MAGLVESTNLREQIYQIILDMILGREILPGEKILEEELAKKMGVSRTPIRECLCRLENEGFVEIIPRRGAFLRKYSKKKVTEIFDIREVLEGLVARLVASGKDPELNDRIKRVLDKVNRLPEKSTDLTEYTLADIEFHRLLLNACNNEILQNAMAVINTQLQILRTRTVVIPGRAKRTVEEHYAVLDAVEKQDPQSAEERMRSHIASVRNHALSSLDFEN